MINRNIVWLQTQVPNQGFVDTKSDPQLSMAVSQLKKELELEHGSGAVGVAGEKKPAAVKSRVTAMALGFEALKTSTETGPKKET